MVRLERLMIFPDLLLADGTRADSLRVSHLYRELVKANVPVTAEMGKQTLLETYAAHIRPATAAEAVQLGK